MEVFLLNMSAFLRPMFDIELAAFSLSDAGAIGIMVLLTVSFFSSAALRQSAEVTSLDIFIFLFVAWCVSVYVIYFDQTDIKQLARITVPLITYVATKNILRGSTDYLRMLYAAICGYVIPVVISAGMTAAGTGLESVNYWTQLPRWKGVYSGSHTMAHAIELLLILVVVYVSAAKWSAFETGKRIGRLGTGLLVSLSVLAIYCMGMTRVRSAILGVLIFIVMYLWVFNKRLMIVGGAIGVGAAILFSPVLFPFFFPDLVMIEKIDGGAMDIGSGRPAIWLKNSSIFLELPIDQQLAGVGIGSNIGGANEEGISNSHNDYLDILVQTGFVGFFLFVSLHVVLLRAILRMPGRERYVFLAAFVAVSLTNAMSNSFVSRAGLNQMYWMLMSYVEVSSRRKSPVAAPPIAKHQVIS